MDNTFAYNRNCIKPEEEIKRESRKPFKIGNYKNKIKKIITTRKKNPSSQPAALVFFFLLHVTQQNKLM